MRRIAVVCLAAMLMMAGDNIKIAEPQSGTVVATNQLPGGAHAQYFKLLDGTLGSANKAVVDSQGALKVDGSAATQPVSGTFWQASQPVSGTVGVSNFPATQPVSGTFWQATQPISGGVSVSNFPATQAVSGTFWQATQPVSGTVGVSNFPATQPVSGTFWQATQPVSATFWQATQPVSGTVGVSNFPATQPVSGTFWQATQPVSGGVSVSNFPEFPALQAVSGTFWQATQPVSGTVSVSNFPATQPVSGTFWQATQPVSGSVSLDSTAGKTRVMKTGNIVTTAVTADQVVLTYTVTAGKTFYVQYWGATARLTTFAVTATWFGAVSLEIVSGTKVWTIDLAGAGASALSGHQMAEPIPIAAGTVVRVVCTPGATTSYTWKANFGGYEK